MDTIIHEVRIARDPRGVRRMRWSAGVAIGGAVLAACFSSASLLLSWQDGSFRQYFTAAALAMLLLSVVLQLRAWLPPLRTQDLTITFTAGGLTYRTEHEHGTVRWPDVRWVRLSQQAIIGPYLHVRVNAPQGSTQRNGLLVPLGSEAPPLHELHRSLTRLSGNTLRVKT
ncbi:hypothetical protein [Bounagaea algeriensis]